MSTYTKTNSLTIDSGSPTGDTIYTAVNDTDGNIDAIIVNLNLCHVASRGDMLYKGASAVSALTVGADNLVLRSNGTDPAWQYDYDPAAKTANATLTVANDVVLVTTADTDRTITLPTAVGISGKRFVIKKVDSGTGAVIIDGNGSQTIDGEIDMAITVQYETVTIMSDNANWHIIGHVSGKHYDADPT